MALWGRTPPPVGGVTSSVALTLRELSRSDVPHRLFDLGTPLTSVAAAARGAMFGRRHDVAVLNLSTLRAFVPMVACGLLSGRRVVAYFHGGSFPLYWSRLGPRRQRLVGAACRHLTAAWVTNADLATWLHGVAPGLPVEVVSPYPVTGVTGEPAADRGLTAAVFAFRGDALYGVPIAVDAVHRLRERGRDWQLTVVLYGSDDANLERHAAHLRDIPWLHVATNLDPEAVESLLHRTAVVLRPTSVDGDALVVRQALAAGCRVVATAVAPRPPGVELVNRDAAAIAAAVEDGAPVSDGTGLGRPVDQAIRDVLAGRR